MCLRHLRRSARDTDWTSAVPRGDCGIQGPDRHCQAVRARHDGLGSGVTTWVPACPLPPVAQFTRLIAMHGQCAVNG